MSKTTEQVIDIKNKPNALIVDVDGTLAYMIDRTPYEYRKAIRDGVHHHIVDIVNRYDGDHTIIILSGRDEECRDVTLEWLMVNDIPHDYVYMRQNKDNRKDSVVKKELFDKYVKDDYNISFVLDDRSQVVEMWREIGLVCLQVAPGDF